MITAIVLRTRKLEIFDFDIEFKKRALYRANNVKNLVLFLLITS